MFTRNSFLTDNKSFETPGEYPRRKALTVTQLNRAVKSQIESEYGDLWLEGEISNFKKHSSGHMYLTLKDDKSQVGAVFFARDNQTARFQIKDGLKVLVFGRASLYEARGQYQFYIQQMEPLGLGALQLAFLQLKEKLQKEGLFAVERKRPIPKIPKSVGVVTSPTGAAIRDILNVVNRRFQGTEVVICPVRVQGDGAAEEIAQGIRQMNALGSMDVLIVGRGGGSLEDLWAFNEEIVARAVFESRIPVISAVGHEIDWTICDWVADLRAPTPSAAAELVVRNREELVRQVAESEVRLGNAVLFQIRDSRKRLEALESSYALRHPVSLVEQYSQRVDEMMRQLQNYAGSYVSEKDLQFRNLAGKLHALSPLATLERGYSVTLNGKGEVLKTTAGLSADAKLETRLLKGRVESQITRVFSEEEV